MKKADNPPSTKAKRLRKLTTEFQELETKLRLGGGAEKIERQHQQGKLTARERIALLLDEGSYAQEIGLLVAYDQYDGGAPGAGVVTVVGRTAGREVVVVANDATVKAGSWWPETIKKILRAQEIAMRSRVPIIYLVDSAGVNLPYQGGVFPGQYGASRIFYYNSIMRRFLKVPQISAVMGPCIAGGAYLPALSDIIIMVDGTSFMGLGGANLVKGATGQTIDNETLGAQRLTMRYRVLLTTELRTTGPASIRFESLFPSYRRLVSESLNQERQVGLLLICTRSCPRTIVNRTTCGSYSSV